MKTMKYYFVGILLIIVTIAVIVMIIKNNQYENDLKYIDEIIVNVNYSDFESFTLCHIIDDNHEEQDYPLRYIYLHKNIQEIENMFNIEFNIKLNPNKYYLFTYGKKIKDLQILFKYDEDDRDIMQRYYYGKIEYEETFTEAMIYIYEVRNANVIYREMTTIESFDESNEIELLKINEDSVNLNVFRNGKVNPLLKNNLYNRFDTTTENKVYYYKYEDPYLYVVNKWGRCTIINVNNKNIIARAEEMEELPEEYREAFMDINSFVDISYIDNIPKENAIEFADGTIYIKNIGGINFIYNEKYQMDILYNIWILARLVKYTIIDNYLYFVDINEEYSIINLTNYSVLYQQCKIEEIPEKYRSIFQDDNLFYELESLFE